VDEPPKPDYRGYRERGHITVFAQYPDRTVTYCSASNAEVNTSKEERRQNQRKHSAFSQVRNRVSALTGIGFSSGGDVGTPRSASNLYPGIGNHGEGH